MASTCAQSTPIWPAASALGSKTAASGGSYPEAQVSDTGSHGRRPFGVCPLKIAKNSIAVAVVPATYVFVRWLAQTAGQ